MKKLTILVLAILLTISLLSAEETQYTNYSFARLSYITGNTYVQRASDFGFEEAVVNMPITEGDRLGTADGRAEVYLGKKNYVRLDNNTKIDFLNLPKRGYDLSRMRIWSGNAYFRLNFLEKEKNIEIHTSDISIYILEKGLYRIDVRENKETEIFVFEGLVEAAGEEGSVLIGSEKRMGVSNGRFISQPSHFYAVAEDSFDRWSEDRDSQVIKRVANRYLSDDLEDFEDELAMYGDWVYLSPYGWVWAPRGLDQTWRPYFYGQWTWLPLASWTWIPYEPWGWAPFHYGRWHWGIGLGWYWIPTSFWGPAWVNWWWGYDYFGWAPLGYYGYPIVIIGDVFYPRYYGYHYPYNNRALTVIRKGQMQANDISQVALRQEEVKQLGNISLTRKAPDVKPVSKEVTLKKLGERTFILKKEPALSEAEKKITKQPLSIEPKKIEERGPEFKEPQRKVIQGRGEPKPKIEIKESPEKEVIKKEKKEGASPLYESRYVKGGSYGYPSSPKVSLKDIPQVKKPGSILGYIYKYISGSERSKYIGRGGSRTSSERSSPSRVSSRTSTRGSSVSSTRSSSGRTSSGTTGSVRKKK